jgi:two-component system cell cycle sensor histidine kinase/response regulator CckA
MTKKTASRDLTLRKRAEMELVSNPSTTDADLGDLDAKRLLHELQVHQVELVMQNEQLQLIIAEKSEHEEHLRNIIKMTPAGYFRLDMNELFVDVNDAWLRMHGYGSPDEVVGKHFSMVQVDSDSDLALKHLSELHRGMPVPIGEFSSRRKDGSIGHHIFSAHPVVHYGKIIGFEWFIIDTSARKQIEDAQSYLLQINSLKPGEDFFESLAQFLAKTLNMDFVCIDRLEGDGLSARTVAVWCDGHFEDNVTYALKDTPCGEVVGKTVCCYPAGVGQFFPRDQVLQELRAESYVGVTLWNHTHQPIGLIAVISRRPLLNRQMVESIMNLVGVRAAGEMERMDAEEVKQNLEKQVIAAQKLESLGVLAGGIAHDFNNILAVIMCYCDLAKQKPEKTGEFMPEIEKAVDRAAGLCRQMLAYAGKTQFVQSQVNMTALVDDILNMLKSTLPQNAEIKPYLTGDLPCIEGDVSQLRQIVMNLIINASEAIGEEHGEIVVSLTKTVVIAGQSDKDHLGKIITPGLYLCLEVTDNGCGMDEETKHRIFEPFYSTKFVGRGLGMSAVLGIITSHKGALQLSSNPGSGTTFKVYLPVQIAEPTGDESLPQVSLLPWQGSGTILLVEDEPQIVAVARALLETLGFKVVEASNGIEALEQHLKNAAEIRVVVTDIGMPLMGGYELIAELKKRDPALPVIVSSGFGDTIVSSKITPGDIAGLISKPYKFEQLREVLRGVVEKKI